MILLNSSAALAGSVLPYDRLEQTGTMKKRFHEFACWQAGFKEPSLDKDYGDEFDFLSAAGFLSQP